MTEGQRRKKQRQRARQRAAKLDAQKESGPDCSYCGTKTKLVKDEAVYARSYGGYVWLCAPCDAFVGCHKGTYIAKGRVSKPALRKLKIQAHAMFDAYWKAAIELRGWTTHEARFKAYRWLADQMGINMDDCHIGMFDELQTQQVIDICKAQRERGKVAV